MRIKKLNRRFLVGVKKQIKITEKAKIFLKNNEQICFLHHKDEYDFVKKNWGFYASPSINSRLKINNFRSFIVMNKKKHIYLMIVSKSKMKYFKDYLKIEKNKIVKELTNGIS